MPSIITPGFDPTALVAVTGPCGESKEVSAADLLQLVAEAAPIDPLAWIWFSPIAPDVITYPIFARFVWLSTLDYEWRVYNGTDWIIKPVAAQSINGAAIKDGTLNLAALTIPGGNALKILQVNSVGSALQFVSTISTISSGTLPITKLIPGPNFYFLQTQGATVVWAAIDTAYIMARITVGSLPLIALEIGDNGQLMTMVAGVPVWADPPAITGLTISGPDTGKFLTNNGTIPQWATLPVPGAGSLAPTVITPGTAGQVLVTTGGVATWTTFSSVLGETRSGPLDLPATWNAWAPAFPPWTYDVRWAHGLSGRPAIVDANFICKVSYGVFTANQSTIPVRNLFAYGADFESYPAAYPPFMIDWDNTYVYLKRTVSAISDLHIIAGRDVVETTGQPMIGRWRVEFIARL